MIILNRQPQEILNPNYYFEIEKSNFVIKVASTVEELRQAQRLRHRVFSAVASGFTGDIDIDDYDQSADHLIVVDKATLNVVGTYRFLLNDKVNKHYSEREFDLTEFLKLPGRKMELGRASVDPSARAGVIITLLWRGIAEYLKISQSEYLFGCSSMWNITTQDMIDLCQAFKAMNLISNVDVLPLASHWPLGFSSHTHELYNSDNKDQKPISDLKAQILFDQYVPTLVKTYIHVGAKFTAPPAYDPKLKTYEFFGFVETKNIDPAFRKKYL